MDNKLTLKSIQELEGMNFYIPAYQRGYRWTKQQVKDLLDDIQEFIDKSKEGFYCIQPLVVKRNIPDRRITEFKNGLEKIKNSDANNTLVEETEKLIFQNTHWEVIDGQQRLTTIYILLSYLNEFKRISKYEIEYETRKDSKGFLDKIEKEKADKNIDFFHMFEAKMVIEKWFTDEIKVSKDVFLDTLLSKVKFIWYESVDEDPIKVFTRLNIGKISLTNAELIKALFLNRSNFGGSNQRVRLQQNRIAIEWDMIEYALQNDEFWLFLHAAGYDRPTRIDFIFDIICQKDKLNLIQDQENTIGNDEYKTFRYFYLWFKSQENIIDIEKCWDEVISVYQTLQEWYNNLELYHYIGFLIENGTPLIDIHDNWNKDSTIELFSNALKAIIKEKVKNCSDLNKQYEVNGNPKTQCRPILLLHNIQTVINQNKTLTENNKYKLPVFYKFPFHLFKKEKWDIEHIDSNTENPLERIEDQKEWLKYSYEFINDNFVFSLPNNQEINLRCAIEDFLKVSAEKISFDVLWSEVVKNTTSNNKLNEEEKNRLWNFTLLDSSTNRSYGNAIFPAKRRILIGKDRGKLISVNDQLKIDENEGAIAFVPPCTKNVFLKYYNPITNNLREWDKKDAETYLENIKDTLSNFLN